MYPLRITRYTTHYQAPTIYYSLPTTHCSLLTANQGAVFDPEHAFFPYLSSLPDELPDLPSWPPAERAELAGTNLGAAADAAAASLASEHAQWWPRLRAGHPRLFARCDLAQLRWARFRRAHFHPRAHRGRS